MAVRIPTYERHVQLDSGAQTIPRITGGHELGRGLSQAGGAMMEVAAHWQKKQEQFDALQEHQARAQLMEQIKVIQAEEATKFDPMKDPPGTYHDRVMARVAPLIAQYQRSVPQSQQQVAQIYGRGIHTGTSHSAATTESSGTNAAVTKEIDRRMGELKASLEQNPDSHPTAIAKMDQIFNDLRALGNITPQQEAIMRRGYLESIGNSTVKGFQSQKRPTEAKEFTQNWVRDREAEEKAKAPAAPAGAAPPKPGGPVDPAKYETKLTPSEEKDFQAWKKENAPKDSGQDYDLRGAFKAGVKPDPETGHWPDTFKKPNHPTFSDQSQYAKDRPDLAGRWDGDTYIPPKTAPAAPAAPKAQGGAATDTLNQKRIAEIDAKPEVKAAIEKVAAETNTDPNLLKVAASIETSGNPKQVTGTHQGLFQLTKAEFGMNNGGKGDINNPEDNTRAFVQVLERNKGLLTQALGREPTPQELYMSHNQGVGGTIAHIQNPDQPAWKTLLATPEGQNKGEAWAKAAVKGNVPGDVLRRLYGNDETRVSSRDFTAIKGTQVAGGSIDDAITNAKTAREPPAQRMLVASADGTVVSDTQPPPSYVGGMNVGGQTPAEQRTLAGYKAASTYKLDEVGAHGYTRGGVQVAPWLVDTVRNASKVLPEGYTAKVISTVDPRSTGTRWHPTGRAIDIQIYDDKGKPVPNVGDPSVPGWKIYEDMAAAAKAYAQDKHGKEMTWGGHFNTGTPYDRMHFQVGGAEGGGSARNFTPEQVQAGRTLLANVQTPGNVQVAGPGVPGVGPDGQPLSRWQQWGNTQTTIIEGGEMKQASIRQAMVAKLKSTLESDVRSRQVTGQGVTLPKDLQDYFKTKELTFDFISNHLGTGTAITHEENKQSADKYYQATGDMKNMSAVEMAERLKTLTPVPGSPDFVKQEKLYNQALATAKSIQDTRNKDPAAAADTLPDVAAAKEEALKDPYNVEKAQALITARVKGMERLQINPLIRTPITNEEARAIGMPLRDQSNPGGPTANAKAVAESIVRLTGQDEKLGQAVLNTVLKQKGIATETAQTTAAALAAAFKKGRETNPLTGAPVDVTPAKPPGYTPSGPDLTGRPDVSDADPYASILGFESGPPSSYADNPPAEGARYIPGMGPLIPADYIEMLRKNPSLEKKFDETYLPGAAEYFLNNGKPQSANVSTPDNPFVAQQPPLSSTSSVMLPQVPDVFTDEEKPPEDAVP